MKAQKQPPLDTSNLVGLTVRVVFGEHHGRQGVISISHRGKAPPRDHVFVELEGSHPGWCVCIPVRDVEVVE